MTAELHIILNIAMAVAVALIGGLVAHRLRLPPIVGYLVAGMVIGPFTPGFSGDQSQIGALAEVGVIFLMFALGIEFSLKELARMRGIALIGTTIQVALLIGVGDGLGWLLGWPPVQGLFFGGIIAISSTMVILKVLLERGELASTHGRVLLSMLVVQDLAVVVLIVVLPKLMNRADLLIVDLELTLLKVGLFIGVTLFLGARVVPRFMRLVERLGSAELFLLTAVVLAVGTATVSALIGLSFALGAFMAGLLLTETEFDHRVVAEVVPMRNLFATLFFVSVGMLIDPFFILNNLPAVLGMALFIMVAKALITFLALLPFRLGSKTLVFTSLGMIQIGEFSFVLAETGHAIGAVPDRLLSLVLTSSLVTILATPAAFWFAPRLDLALAKLPGLGRLFGAHLEIVGESTAFAGHALVIGYGRVGRRVTAGLRAAGLTVVVLEQDLHLIHELSAAGIPSIYGDASYQTIMQAAHADRARLIVVALPDAGGTRAVVLNARRANPSAPILARVASNEHDEEIVTAGASSIVAPERAGSLLLLQEAARAVEEDNPRVAAALRDLVSRDVTDPLRHMVARGIAEPPQAAADPEIAG